MSVSWGVKSVESSTAQTGGDVRMMSVSYCDIAEVCSDWATSARPR